MTFATVLQRLAKLDNPYPGLRPFETAESHLFFGRDQQILDLSDRLTRNRFVAVLGLSGSGKSSLVRAGLIPALQRGHLLEPGRTWRIAQTRPSGSPFANLASSLGCNPAALRSSSRGLIEIAGNEQPLLILIDQFEELFRYKDRATGDSATPSEAAAFISLLLASSRSPLPIYVVITMRTDYLGDCAEFPEFPEALNESQYLVPRLTREQRRQAIEGPLGRVQISSALVEQILNDAGDEPDQLPILQHALMRTWSQWRKSSPENDRPINAADYQAIGGFAGALNQHANELLQSLANPKFAEIIFKRLTALGRGNRERRDPAQLSELWELCNAVTPEKQRRVAAVIDVFRQGDATFLAPRDGDLTPATYIDIAHESLIRNWELLAETWLPEEEKQAKTLIELLDRAGGWKARTRDLLVGLDLSSALEWKSQINPSPKWAEHYAGPGAIDEVESFLSASHKKFEDDQQKALESFERELMTEKQLRETAERKEEVIRSSARRTRIFSYVLAALLVGALALALIAWRATIQARDQRKLAESAAARALDQQKMAEIQKEAAQSAQFRAAEQQRLAEFQKKRAESATFLAQNQQKLAESRELAAKSEALIASGNHGEALETAIHAFFIEKTSEAREAIAHAFPEESAKLEGHSGPIVTAAFSPEGQRVVTASRDATARVWNAATGQTIAKLEGHSGVVDDAEFSPDGQRVVTASADKTARIWEAAGGRLIAKLEGHSGVVWSAAFSPDGQRVVTASDDHTARVWNAASGQPMAKMEGHSGMVVWAEFSPDGLRVVTASGDTAGIWYAASGQLIAKLEGHSAAVFRARFSPNGQSVVTASADHTARVWNTTTGQVIAKLVGHSGPVYRAKFSPDGRRVLTASDDKTARVWDAATGHLIAELEGHAETVESTASSPNGRLMVTASRDKTARVWDTATGLLIAKLEGHSSAVLSAAFSPDGRRVLTASVDKTARVWNISSTAAVAARLEGSSSMIETAAFSPDGKRVLTRDGNYTRVWNSDSGHLIETRERSSVSSPSAAAPLLLFLGGMNPISVFSTDGRREVRASGDHTAVVRNTATGQLIATLQGHSDDVKSAAFSPDGSRVATGSDDKTARIWNAVTGQPIAKLEGHSAGVNSVAFSPDGQRVVTASWDGTARVWNASTGQAIATLTGHSSPVTTPAFSPDGQRIVTAELDGTALIWRIVTLDEITRLLASK